VRIAPEGWTIEPMAAVPFIRSDGLRALPVPQAGGSIAELAGFVNVEGGAEGEDFRLIVSTSCSPCVGTANFSSARPMMKRVKRKTAVAAA
jgi:hypothetical protein